VKHLRDIALDVSASSFTGLGMMVAWIVLPESGTRDFVGVSILALIALWAITGPLRWGKD
jgi:hypothetical protein